MMKKGNHVRQVANKWSVSSMRDNCLIQVCILLPLLVHVYRVKIILNVV
jgi:hypothetical protein